MNNTVSLKSVITGFEKEYGREHTDLDIHTYASAINVTTSYDNETRVRFRMKLNHDQIVLHRTQIFSTEVLAKNTSDIANVHNARNDFMDTMNLDENDNLVINLEPEFLIRISEANKTAMENLKKDMTTWKDDMTTSENMMELVAGRRALEKHEKLQAFLDEHNPVKKVIKPVEERTFDSNIAITDTAIENEIGKE